MSSLFDLATFPGWTGLLLYLLGLVSGGLLLTPWPQRDRMIACILSALWLWMALLRSTPWPANPSWILWLAIGSLVLQALLFLVLGGIADKLRFDAYAGPWPVLGGILLVDSLVAHPLLVFGEKGGFHDPTIVPFPPLILTWGLLLFCRLRFRLPRRRDSRLAMWGLGVIPLLWTALGPPDPQPILLPQSWGLRIVFILGFFFLALPEGLWRRHRWWPDRRMLYELCRDWRKPLGTSLFVLLVAILALGFFVFNKKPANPSWGRLLTSLFFLEASLLAFWSGFPAWLNLWFCAVAWKAASAAGRLLSWLKASAKWIVLLGVAIVLMDFCAYRAVPKARPPWGGMEGEVWEVRFLTTAFLLWLVYLAYQARKRLVIQAFADHTGDGGLKAAVLGIDGRLRNELARISDVYRVIDEARPRAYLFVGVDADVQDVGDILKEASGTGTSFQLFGMQIPINFLFALLGRLVKGPRITGSVEGCGEDLALTAELSGGRFRGNWRVHPGDIDREEHGLSGEELLRALTKQLAYRIATQVANIGSPRWRAVRRFTRGLSFYRETQRTEKDRDHNLRQAERNLFEAIQDDRDFASCHYNLGIVYKRLGELGSAEAAFRVALKKAPENYEACYALAEIHVEMKDYAEALQLCEIAIRIDPKDARAWDLKSYALRELEQKRRNCPWTLPEGDEVWKELLKPRRIAAALAWRRLCWARLAAPAPVLQRRRDTAVLCTRNLAVVLGRSGHVKPSARAFREALRLSPHAQDLLFSLGKTLYWGADWSRAAEVLENTFGEALPPQLRGSRLAMLVRIETQPRAKMWMTRTQERRNPGSQRAHRHGTERRKAERRGATFRKLLDHAASARRPDLEELRHVIDDCVERPQTTEKNFPGLQEQNEKFERLRGIKDIEISARELEEAYSALAGLGLGEDGTGAGKLKLLRRMRRFLLLLIPPGPKTHPSREELEELEALRNDLESHLRPRGDSAPDDLDLDRLVKRLRRKEPPGARRDGLQLLFRGEPDEPGAPDEDAAAALQSFLDKVEALRQAAPPGPSGEVEHQTEWLLRECRGDVFLVLQWACAQTEVAVCRRCLGAGAVHPERSKLANLAQETIEAAIRRLEKLDFQQPCQQGLYSLWAQACLEAAEACGEPQNRSHLLTQALLHGQLAVGLQPHGADARLVLVKIYTALGDYQQAKKESEICVATCLANEPEQEPAILHAIGAAYWAWMRSAQSPRLREDVVQDAVVFFTRVLRLIESRAFRRENATEQTQSHAWAHYWLGRFYIEQGDHENGILHQKIGCVLGFRPLEARVNLAWAHLMAREYEDADQAFLDARDEAERQQRWEPASSGIADEGDGGDRTLDDLLTDLYLGWGFLAIESSASLDSAQWRLLWAEHLVSPLLGPARKRALQAAIQEGLAWIALRQGHLAESLRAANESLRQMRRCGTYCCLARARLAQADEDPLKAAQEARISARRALELDVRKRYRREIREILLEARKTERAFRQPAG